MFARIQSDIQCILDRDPAARSRWEVLTCYPGLHALILHRFAHACWGLGLRWLSSKGGRGRGGGWAQILF